MTKTTSFGKAVAAMATFALVFTTLIGLGAPAQAVSTQGPTTNYTATFYAYVNKGERMRLQLVDSVNLAVYNQDNTAVAVDSNGYTPTAKADGVWRIVSGVAEGANGFTYDMSVRAGTTEKPGRIWVYEDSIEQRFFSDLEYWGVSDLGYIYKITMPQARAYTTKIALRSSGPAPDRKCNVENRSFDAGDVYLTAYMDCGDKYRLFFEDPRNSGLPATAKLVNKMVPVLPALVNSSELKSTTKTLFTPSPDSIGGVFNVNSHEAFSGTADLQIDTNNNGSYTDLVDRQETVVINQGVGLDWEWDGKDGQGKAVRNGAKARAVISKGGEAHLMVHDAESFGGLTMTRLNGDAPDSKIYWDDSAIKRPRGGDPTPVTSCLNGCNSNVSEGVHGWLNGKLVPGYANSESWGDGSLINNWAFASVNAVSPAIGLPAVYELTFDTTGGTLSGVSSIMRPAGSSWGTLPSASQSAKVLLGWYTAKTGGTSVTSASKATANITAYAQWRPAKFSVVFYGNAQMGKITGGTASMSVDSGCTTCYLTPNGFKKTTGALEMVEQGNDDKTEVYSKFLGWSLDPLSHTGDIADRAVAGNLSKTDGATVKLYAVWDDAPRFVIESYPNRFFNLAQAKSGAITEAELLRTVKATDKETIPLVRKTRAQVVSSGSDVGITLYDYDAADYTSLTDSGVVSTTYKVKDEAGHVAFLRIRVTVSNGAVITPDATTYLRGISPEYVDKGSAAGGLSEDSLWRTDPVRRAALEKAFSDAGAGTTYCLTTGAIDQVRAQMKNHGLGNSEISHGLSTSAGVLSGQRACS